MKTITIIFTILFLFFQSTAYCISDSVENIKNFSLLSEKLASSGMPSQPELELAKQSGYQHIINLIPGDFSDEKNKIGALEMSFDQIAVEWSEPTLADFQHFVRLMQTYKQDKVLVHCRLNYRASAFAYLYQTTQLGADESAAQKQMLEIWQPNDTWLEFINGVQEHYKSKNKKRK